MNIKKLTNPKTINGRMIKSSCITALILLVCTCVVQVWSSYTVKLFIGIIAGSAIALYIIIMLLLAILKEVNK